MSRWKVPIEVYRGTPGATAGQWYSAMVSKLLANGNAPTSDAVEGILRPISEYAAAVSFAQWAKLSDADIEPGLQDKIDEHIASPLQDAVLPPSDGIDRNAEDNMFPPDEKLSDFVGRIAERVIRSERMSSSGYGNDIIWMTGEKGAHSRPEFKDTAFDKFVDEFVYEAWFVFEGVLRYC